MVASSRYQNYFPTLPAEIQQDVYSRMNDLLMEEKEYCDKGNYVHMSQILTSIALYEVLQKHGYSEEEAYRAASEEMWKFLDPSGMQKLARKSFFLPLMKRSFPSDSRKAPAMAGATHGTRTIRRMNSVLSAMNVSTQRSSGKEA
jgi:hypothetical protein